MSPVEAFASRILEVQLVRLSPHQLLIRTGPITEHPPHPRIVSLRMFVLPESGRVSGNDFGGGAAGPS